MLAVLVAIPAIAYLPHDPMVQTAVAIAALSVILGLASASSP
jgi:hypothetical protein